MGMRGNLMAGEILEQLIIANRFEKIRNIVFMGMVSQSDTYTRTHPSHTRPPLSPNAMTLNKKFET